MNPLLHLSSDDVRRALPMRDAFTLSSRDEVTLPTRVGL